MAPAKSALDNYDAYVKDNPGATVRSARDRDSKLGWRLRCIRQTLYYLNVAFFLAGVTTLIIGGILYSQPSSGFVNAVFAIALAIIGAVVILVSVFGCCGANRESRSLLCVYMVVLVGLIAAQVGLGAFAFSQSSDAQSILEDRWATASADTLIDIQKEFKCCGSTVFMKDAPGGVCPEAATEPCIPKIKADVESNAQVMGILGIAFGSLQLLGLLFSCCLITGIRESWEEEELKQAEAQLAREQRR